MLLAIGAEAPNIENVKKGEEEPKGVDAIVEGAKANFPSPCNDENLGLRVPCAPKSVAQP